MLYTHSPMFLNHRGCLFYFLKLFISLVGLIEVRNCCDSVFLSRVSTHGEKHPDK